MTETAIFLPMCVLAFWTFAVLALVPIVRIRASLAGRVGPKDFAYGESANVPGQVALPNRDYMNLLELPVLFYVVTLAIHATRQVDDLYVTLAWIFVVSRIGHSLVHLSYNNVLHRLAVFSLGVVTLLVMWARFAWGLL